MPNAKPFPLYTDGTNIYTSFDGGATFITISSGGGGTIHTSTPLSGDGSVGTPATIANGAITNVKLATPPQDPAAVAITGGSITGTSVQGFTAAQLTADLGWVDQLWGQKQYTAMKAAVPGITAFEWTPVGVNPIASMTSQVGNTALAYDAATEGGWITPANGDLFTFGASVFQNTPGGNWAVSAQVKMALPSLSGLDCEFGLKDTAFNNWMALGAVNTWDATNWQARIKGAGTATQLTTTTAVTTATHDLMWTDDGTTVKIWVDGVMVGSTATRTQLVTAAMQIYIANVTAGQTKVKRIAWGYVQS